MHFISSRIQKQVATILTLLISISSCIKNPEFTQNAHLKISADTVFFDTLFTRQAQTGTYPISVTKLLSIKNPSDFWVKAQIHLAGGNNSPFRINVDGLSGNKIDDLEIGPRDSVFLFVQCKLEANNELLPILVLDSLFARVGNQQSKLVLAAYGWDAHYIRDSIIPHNTVWADANKPYVIIDGAYVPPQSQLSIEKGVRVFSSARSALYVLGNLKVNGTPDNRVVFQGDRPLHAFQRAPNQWYGIFVTPGGTAQVKYADITNAIIGLRTDSMGQGMLPSVILENTKIQYCSQACLVGVSGAIKAQNCLFADAGSYTFLGFFGGNYEFDHCTFAEHSYYANRNQGHFGLTNTLRDGNGFLRETKDLKISIQNSLVWGYKQEEFSVDRSELSAFDFQENEYNLVKTKNEFNFFRHSSHLLNIDPLFIDFRKGNYELNENSPAKDQIPISSTPIDLWGKPRNMPADIGAFEIP